MNSEKKNDENNKENEQKIKESKIIKQEILMTFNEENEKNGKNIIYNEVGVNKKIKYISLDLLLKKIVIDDFLENNVLLIYHFCQQCFCFIETKILFTKINNCYNFFRSQGALPKHLSNIITFFNILVIEMYQYYKEINEDNPSLILVKNFYENIIKDFKEESLQNNKNENSLNIRVSFKGNNMIDLPENDENYKINLTKNINRSYFKKINNENLNKDEERQTNWYCKNFYSINDNNNSNNNENKINFYPNDYENYNKKENKISNNNKINGPEIVEKKINRNNCKNAKKEHNLEEIINIDDNINDIKKANNKENILVKNSTNNLGIYKLEDELDIYKKHEKVNNVTKSRRTLFDNINYSNTSKTLDLIDNEEELLCSKTTKTYNIIEEKNEKKNENYSKEKKHFHIFGFLKKSKEKKLNKRSCDVIRKSIKDYNNLRKSIKIYKTQDEHILSNIKDIKNFLLTKNPNLDTIKNSILFYKNINKLYPEKIKNENMKTEKLKKCNTEDNLLKKKKKIKETKEYFDVSDWDEKDIGNKLMLISESLLNKIQRKELYKAVYLKKNKYKICPNVMENIEKFNRLSFFIILDILSYDSPKDRAKMIEKWAKIAEYCKKINNFNDLFAINSALNNYIVTGLNLTFKEIQKKTISLIKEIKKFCDCKGNYKTLRDYISNLKPGEYYLPYLGILLRDLTFFEEKSKYIINGVLINLEKIEKIQKTLDIFFKFRYLEKKEINKIPKELNFLENLENLKEEKLEKIANNIEPNFNYAQKKIKRFTEIDKKYFSNESKISSKD